MIENREKRGGLSSENLFAPVAVGSGRSTKGQVDVLCVGRLVVENDGRADLLPKQPAVQQHLDLARSKILHRVRLPKIHAEARRVAGQEHAAHAGPGLFCTSIFSPRKKKTHVKPTRGNTPSQIIFFLSFLSFLFASSVSASHPPHTEAIT
jgi:hypothetical protein